MSGEAFDYVIVGAGSAGCVLADRLTEDGKSTVLVLEYGGSDRSLFIQMPAALSIPMNSRTYNWGYRERARAASRRPAPPSARAARCSAARPRSTASSMCAAIRSTSSAGRRRARRAGAIANVLPYFRRAESFRRRRRRLARRRRAARHCAGPKHNPLYDAFIEAGREAGYPVSADLNGEQQEGFGALDMTVKDGVRWSTANAYLRPAMKRPNLKVVTACARDAHRLRGPPRRRRRATCAGGERKVARAGAR